MLKQIKNMTVRRALRFPIIVLVLAAIIAIGATGLRIIDAVRGPSDIMRDRLSTDELTEGAYVSAEGYVIVKQIMSEYTQSGLMERRYYLLRADGASGDIYLSVSIGENSYELFDQLYRSQKEFLAGDADTLPDYPVLSGTLRSSAELAKRAQSYLESSGLPGVTALSDIYIDEGVCGILPPLWVYLLTAAGTAALLAALYILVRATSGGYMQRVIGYADRNLSGRIGSIEIDFDNAEHFGDVVIGKKWLIFVPKRHISARVLDLDEVTWAYNLAVVSKRTMRVMLIIHLGRKRRGVEIKCSPEKRAFEALEKLRVEQEHIVIGYNKEYKKLFRTDHEAFLPLASKQREQASENAQPSDETDAQTAPSNEAVAAVSVEEAPTDSASESVEGTAAKPVEESVTEPVEEPVAEPAPEPIAESIAEPTAEPLTEQAAEPDIKPDAGSGDETPVAEPAEQTDEEQKDDAPAASALTSPDEFDDAETLGDLAGLDLTDELFNFDILDELDDFDDDDVS